MRIDIITLFPEFFDTLKTHSIVGRAVKDKKIEIVTHNLRDYATDKYGSVDDKPYGGGVGMVLRFDVLLNAINDVKTNLKSQMPTNSQIKVILLTPQGSAYKQVVAEELAKQENLILVAGHYEGFDERIREYVDMEISIGDYVLTGGEIPAMVLVDSVARLLPGVLGHDDSSMDESFSESMMGGLEYPQYTRPVEYDGKKVPEILLSGNHPEIDKWRMEQVKVKTENKRPDLVKK